MFKLFPTLSRAMVAAAMLLPSTMNAQTPSTASAYDVPFSELWMSWKSDLKNNVWTVEDKNNDKITWGADLGVGNLMCYDGSAQKQDADDWIVSPPIKLVAGQAYRIETSAFRTSQGGQGELSIAYGLSDDPSEYTTIVDKTAVTSALSWGGTLNATQLSGVFTAPTTGNYRFGIHATSKQRGAILLNGVKVTSEAATSVRPATINDLVVEVGAKGAISAKVKFTVPAKDYKGAPLSSVSRVQIYRDYNDLVKVYENPTPGQQIEWNDEAVTGGKHVYSVYTTANDIRSDEAQTSVYVGVDTPMAPQNVRVWDNLDGTAKLMWDETTENSGANGGYVDISERYYHVYLLEYGYLKEPGANYEGLTKPEYTLTDVNYEGSQYVKQYVVKALTNTPTDTLAISEYGRYGFAVGKPHAMPWVESFPGKTLGAGPWMIDATQTGRFGLGEESQDNDNGSLIFSPQKGQTCACIQGPKVDIANAGNPQLVFWYYAVPGTDGKITMKILRNGQTMETAGVVDYNELEGEQGWRSVAFDLSQFSTTGTENGYIRPFIYAEAENTSIQIDNIKIYDAVASNIEATIDAPAHVQKGKKCGVTINVTNLGTAKASGYTVSLYVDGKKLETQDGEDLEPNEKASYEFAFTPNIYTVDFSVQGEAEWDADVVPENNLTEEKIVYVTSAVLPAITDLALQQNGSNAVLTWTGMNNVEGTTVYDSFENYTPWLISNVGDWTLYDGDKAGTYGFGGITYPHMKDAASFIVFNPWQVSGLSSDILDQFASVFDPHNGKQFMLASAATIDTGTPTNDWLISPSLSGEEQTVSFWVKAPNDQVTNNATYPNAGPETFDVYYSEDDNNASSFIKINKESLEATCYWTKHEINLPEGALYFAIVYTTTGGLTSYSYEPNYFCVDDVTYKTGGLKVMGYNVYRDGELVKKLDANTTTWTDTEASGTHTYVVITVYANGESLASNTVGVGDNWTGIDDIVVAPNNANAPVYNTAGQRVGNNLKDVKGGIFIQNGRKVVVK